MLRSNKDVYHKYPGFPVFSSFENKENDEMKIHVTIPKIEEQNNSMRLERVETHQVYHSEKMDPFYEEIPNHSVMDITEPEILARIEESITDPRLHSGPSGNFLGMVASSHFFGFLTSAAGHVLYETLAVANKLYKTIWTTRAFKDKSHEVPMGLADGGAHENTGIVAAVKNLQHHDKINGRIFAIVPKQLRSGIKREKLRGLKVGSQYNELKNLFESTQKISGVKPYPKIFKGSFDDYKVELISSGNIDAFVIEVQTIDNEDYGIKAGSAYKLIYVSPLCRSEKVQKIGGNSNGDIALLPSMGTALAYAECADIIGKDMRELLQLQQEFIKPVPKVYTDKATMQTNEKFKENITEKQENIENSVQNNNPNEISATISWMFALSCILLN